MTINLTRCFGANFRVMPDAKGRRHLVAVIWFPRTKHRLGYLYPSFPLFGL